MQTLDNNLSHKDLGLTDEEIQALIDEEILEDPPTSFAS